MAHGSLGRPVTTWALIAALASSFGPSLAAERGAAAHEQDQVGMVTWSWGRLSSDWFIRSDGSGQFRSPRHARPSTEPDIIVTRRLPAAKGRYAQVEALLRGAEPYAGGALPCTDLISDMPGGEIHWRRNGVMLTVSFVYGCQSDTEKRGLGQIGAAYDLVAHWAADAPVVEERPK